MKTPKKWQQGSILADKLLDEIKDEEMRNDFLDFEEHLEWEEQEGDD